MASATQVAVQCEILRGGFSGERVVLIRTADGSERKGLAPTDYCWKADRTPLGPEDPSNGARVQGYVAARLHGTTANGQAIVEIPDGEVMIVPQASVIQRPSAEIASHVPVGS
jgi:hypothetical protein